MTFKDALIDRKQCLEYLEANQKRIKPSSLEAVRKSVEALEKRVPKKEKHDVCPACGTSNRFIIENLGNPKGHPVVYCWNCGQAIELTWKTGEDERCIRHGGKDK